MPHERIHSLDADPDHANCVQVAWGSPSSPSNTGPGHGNGEGHIMVIVERPGNGMRTGASVEETTRRLTDILSQVDRDQPTAALAEQLVSRWGSDLCYAFGAEADLLAVMLDRPACNKLIRATRKGRDVAFGRDE